jgi:cytidylate kinase
LDTEGLVSLVQQIVMEAVAAGPCVIVGRGAPYFLHDRTDTFCVFLYASRDQRFRRIQKRTRTLAEAVELVDHMDEERRKFIKHYHGCEWSDRHFFHAMINTAIGDDATVEAILYLMNLASQTGEAVKS